MPFLQTGAGGRFAAGARFTALGVIQDEHRSTQHRTEGALIERVLEWVVQAKAGSVGSVLALGEAVDALATHVLHHIGFEERIVLPAARQWLKDDDWAEIAQAFAINDSPDYGDLPTEELRKLFTQIANSVSQKHPLPVRS